MTVRMILAATAVLALGACASDGTGGGGAATGGSAGYAAATGALGAPKNLVGKSENEVQSSLGKPAFTRQDGPARVYQYRGTSCLLDVFLYKEGSAYRVKHAEVRQRSGNRLTENACLANAVAGGKAKS